MSINLNFTNNSQVQSSSNYILFYDKNKSIHGLDKSNLKKYASELEKNIKFLKSKEEKYEFFNLENGIKITLIEFNNNLSSLEIEKKGASLNEFLKKNKMLNNFFLLENLDLFKKQKYIFFIKFLHGLLLKSYEFNKYKTSKNSKQIVVLNIPLKIKEFLKKRFNRYDALLEGIKLTRDLVSEPGNVLHPDEYAKRLNLLKKDGLKVNILDEKKLKKLGMNTLLGVGQGSTRGSYLVTIEWNGLKNNSKPLAFVGKGVCFDTGGISLKPAKFMEDMTYDMAGSAVVVGLMKSLALRKAKINAVGVVGLVENMPGGNAQRPGDIVKSYSGKTVEILNTDAEGRLVLADALTYTEEKYKPKFMVDLATLTGAIIVSLGSEYAGLFSNDDKLSKQLINAGKDVEEKVWRMPLNENFDKLINSKKADMQNINYVGGAGSITAAQFLQRFILNKTPWAHLDIAGMAFSKYGGALNSGGATGFGVRLLNQLIEDNYE